MFLIAFLRQFRAARHGAVWLLYLLYFYLLNQWHHSSANLIGILFLWGILAAAFYVTYILLWMIYEKKSRPKGILLLCLAIPGLYILSLWYVNGVVPAFGGILRKPWAHFTATRFTRDFVVSLGRITACAAIYFLAKVAILQREKKQQAEMAQLRTEKETHKLALKAERLEKEKLEIHNSFLASQINPHFLRNYFSFISSKALEYGDEPLQASLINMGDLLGYIVSSSRNNGSLVFVAREVELLKEVVNLMRIMAGSDEVVELEQEGEPSAQLIPSLSLLTLMDNMLKHGLWSVRFPVQVNLRFTDSSLFFSCRNAIKPPSYHRDPADTGLGLSNVEQRLYREFKDQYNLSIKTEGNFFTVFLTINYRNE